MTILTKKLGQFPIRGTPQREFGHENGHGGVVTTSGGIDLLNGKRGSNPLMREVAGHEISKPPRQWHFGERGAWGKD